MSAQTKLKTIGRPGLEYRAFGQALKKEREARGMTLKVLNAALPIPYSDESSLRRIERGDSRPQERETLLAIAQIFHMRDEKRINRLLHMAKYDGLNEEEKAAICDAPQAQKVSWGPPDHPPGIAIDSPVRTFVPWSVLRPEIEQRLLPKVRVLPVGCTVELGEFRGRKHWIVRILDPNHVEIGNIWFGTDPNNKWAWDGKVRLGPFRAKDAIPYKVWQVFERYTDGTYRRVEAFM